MVDEAHRTQYGTLSVNMRTALPNAIYLGFTGTPIGEYENGFTECHLLRVYWNAN